MSEDNPFASQQVLTKEFAQIPLDLIDDPQRPMRTDMDEESLAELARSIKQVGLIEPIIVIRKGDRYEVVAGHRRTLASELAGLVIVPCHIVEATGDQAEMMKIHENLFRLDVSPADEAQHYAYLMETQNLTPTRIAQLINRSVKYVTSRLDILTYDEELRAALQKGLINFSAAQEFSRLDDKRLLRQYLSYAIRSGITTGVAKKWVDDALKPAVDDNEFTTPTYDDQLIVPSNEQTSKCFYCVQDVKLLEAHVVYVHEQCLNERMQPVDSGGSTPRTPDTQAEPSAASG